MGVTVIMIQRIMTEMRAYVTGGRGSGLGHSDLVRPFLLFSSCLLHIPGANSRKDFKTIVGRIYCSSNQLSPSGFHVDFRSTVVGVTLSHNVADTDNAHLLLLGTDHSRASRGSSL